MRFEQLEYLIEISKCSSINEASRNLHISHQAITTAIKALESELSVNLLNRGYRGTSLTAEGKYIVKATLDFFHKIDRINTCGKTNDAELRGSLSILSTYFAAETYLSQAIMAFYNHYPHIQISNQILVPRDVVLCFSAGQADLAFLQMAEQDFAGLEQIDLFFKPCVEIAACIEVSRQSSLAQYKSVSLNMLKNQEIIYNCAADIAAAQINNGFFRYIHGKKTRFETSRRVYHELLLSDYGVGVVGLRKDKPLISEWSDIATIPLRDVPSCYFGYLFRKKAFGKLPQAFLNLL